MISHIASEDLLSQQTLFGLGVQLERIPIRQSTMTSDIDLGVLSFVETISGVNLAASVISSMISERVPITLRQRWR